MYSRTYLYRTFLVGSILLGLTLVACVADPGPGEDEWREIDEALPGTFAQKGLTRKTSPRVIKPLAAPIDMTKPSQVCSQASYKARGNTRLNMELLVQGITKYAYDKMVSNGAFVLGDSPNQDLKKLLEQVVTESEKFGSNCVKGCAYNREGIDVSVYAGNSHQKNWATGPPQDNGLAVGKAYGLDLPGTVQHFGEEKVTMLFFYMEKRGKRAAGTPPGYAYIKFEDAGVCRAADKISHLGSFAKSTSAGAAGMNFDDCSPTITQGTGARKLDKKISMCPSKEKFKPFGAVDKAGKFWGKKRKKTRCAFEDNNCRKGPCMNNVGKTWPSMPAFGQYEGQRFEQYRKAFNNPNDNRRNDQTDAQDKEQHHYCMTHRSGCEDYLGPLQWSDGKGGFSASFLPRRI